MQTPLQEPGTLGLHSTRKGRILGNCQHIPARDATPGFPACGAELCLTCSPRRMGEQGEFSRLRRSGIDGFMKDVIKDRGKGEVFLGRMG